MNDRYYEVWVKKGDKGGPVTPAGQQGPCINDYATAFRIAQDFAKQCDQVVITEVRVVACFGPGGAAPGVKPGPQNRIPRNFFEG